MTVGCEATGPYWLSRDEALTAQGYQVLVLTPLYVKARHGTTLRGTKTDPVDARLMAEILPREQVPASHVPAVLCWHGVVDHLNLHPSESWQRCVGSASGLELDLGAKGQRGILQSMAHPGGVSVEYRKHVREGNYDLGGIGYKREYRYMTQGHITTKLRRSAMRVINVEGLPDEIVQALERIVQAFRARVGAGPEPRLPVGIPVWPGTVPGRLTRGNL